MEPTLLTSFIGIIVFASLVTCGFQYASGKWNVAENKKEAYSIWVDSNGRKLRKSLIVLSVIYGFAMVMQIIELVY